MHPFQAIPSGRRLVTGLFACVSLLAACSAEPVTSASSGADADPSSLSAAERQTASERWIALTRQVVGRRNAGPLGTARTYALVAVAQYDAVVAAGDAKARGTHPSEAGAVAGAAAAVLRAIYPGEAGAVASQLAADEAFFTGSPFERDADFAAGVTIGEQVATAVLARAATDGSDVTWTGTIPTGPGYWLATPVPPLEPGWGQVRPWLMTSGDQFRPAPPPAFGSAEFLTALAEVRAYTVNLTPEQLVIAQFWQGGSGPGGPMGHFGAVATRLAGEHQLTELQASRMFAVMYMAMMDASIGCWDAKFAYWYIRPHQADPLIATPVGRPPFPSYPSAHSCFSAAAVGVLRDLFPASRDELEAMVAEAGVARLYAGLHYMFDITAGQELGYAVARLALEQAPRGMAAIPLD